MPEIYKDSVRHRGIVYKRAKGIHTARFKTIKTAATCTKYEHLVDGCINYLMIDDKGQLIESYSWCEGEISAIMVRYLYDSVGNRIIFEERTDIFTSMNREISYYE